MSKIFISHSSKDNVNAEQVKARLAQWGHRSVFLDFDPEHGIPAGRDWEKELYAKLRECRAVIFLCSHASMASRWCFAEVTHARAQGKPVISIRIDQVPLDFILTKDQVINAAAGWDDAYQRLERGLLAAGLDPKDLFDWDTTRPPYPGLLALQENDAAIFFGRDKEIREGQAELNRLQQFGGSRLTLMLGASGSGKSSLMRAGLLPRLKRDPRWLVIAPFRPLKAPFDELAYVLSERFSHVTQREQETPRDIAHVRDRIRWQEYDIKQLVETFLELINELREGAKSREATVLLMIDQCEELLAISANEEGNKFLPFLRALLDREDSHLLVLATLRSDFLGPFQEHPAMRGLRFNTMQVPQMEVDALASLIEGPARLAGLELGPGLVQAMITDTKTSDALPLLAFTLRELYEGYVEDELLTLEEYRDRLGRLDGCIARAAEAVLKAKPLSEKETTDLRTAFLSMVRVNDRGQYAKQPAQWRDLPASIHEVLERFVTARLLISSSNEYGETLEVAHEALLRAWPRLAEWLKDNRLFLVWQQRLRQSVSQYEERERKSDFLLRGFPLTEALEWQKKKPNSFTPSERQFIKASQNQALRGRIVTATVVSLVLVLMTGTTWLAQKGYRLVHAQLLVQSLKGNIHVEPQKMTRISGGTFQQGNLEQLQTSQPVHSVRIKPFALSKHEVTFEEYDRFAIATGRQVPNDSGWGRGRRPVINVSWRDAKAYAAWLSEKTGKHYRLPTESEWEYAARSGHKQRAWAGTSEASEIGTYAVFTKNSRGTTGIVGEKAPNEFGLYDMNGNVWEWVEDCWHDTYTNAPKDGSAWREVNGGDCGGHLIRGGSWLSGPEFLPTSFRNRGSSDGRGNDIGFRLAQDIEE